MPNAVDAQKTEPDVAIRAEYMDGSILDFPLGRATVVRTGGRAGLELHLDRMQDGRCLLICSDTMWPDGKRLKCLTVMRGAAPRKPSKLEV